MPVISSSQEEELALWQEFELEQQAQLEEELAEPEAEVEENPFCPCGDRMSDHHLEQGYCYNCNCPEFGRPTSEWETYTEVWFTEPPCGHRGYE